VEFFPGEGGTVQPLLKGEGTYHSTFQYGEKEKKTTFLMRGEKREKKGKPREGSSDPAHPQGEVILCFPGV